MTTMWVLLHRTASAFADCCVEAAIRAFVSRSCATRSLWPCALPCHPVNHVGTHGRGFAAWPRPLGHRLECRHLTLFCICSPRPQHTDQLGDTDAAIRRTHRYLKDVSAKARRRGRVQPSTVAPHDGDGAAKKKKKKKKQKKKKKRSRPEDDY